MALPAKIPEVALEKTARKRRMEMAMLALRERMERLDVYEMRLGMETLRPSSRDSPEPAGDGPGGEPRHGDADQQSVPDGVDEADGNLNSANPERGSDRSEAGLRSGEQEKLCKHETKNEKETTAELEQANSAVEIAKRKVGPATGLASDVAMLLELLRPHLSSLSRRTQRT